MTAAGAMSERPAPVTRPNGKVWRGRNPIRVDEFTDSDYCTGFAVWGTHDVEAAAALAGIARLADDYGLDVEDARREWWRKVPWDTTGGGFDYSYVTDPVHGTPVVAWYPS